MAWFGSSVLPEPLIILEIWLVRLFLLLSVLCIVPILLFFVYDFLLYIWRTVTYELPIIGGRARGKRRPRAPSLKGTAPSKRIMAMVGQDQPSEGPAEQTIGTTSQSHIPKLPQRVQHEASGNVNE